MNKNEIAVIDEQLLKDKIYVIRGQQVMLDCDLAEIYGYTTKAFNQQVKNNIGKFDVDFRFQLTEEEADNLRSNYLTSSWGGSRYLPYAFTEQGIYMLMTVLRGDPAVQQSKALIRLFDVGIREEVLILDGEPFRADAAYLIVIDDYISVKTLCRHVLAKDGTDLTVISDNKGNKPLRMSEYNDYLPEYPGKNIRFPLLKDTGVFCLFCLFSRL